MSSIELINLKYDSNISNHNNNTNNNNNAVDARKIEYRKRELNEKFSDNGLVSSNEINTKSETLSTKKSNIPSLARHNRHLAHVNKLNFNYSPDLINKQKSKHEKPELGKNENLISNKTNKNNNAANSIASKLNSSSNSNYVLQLKSTYLGEANSKTNLTESSNNNNNNNNSNNNKNNKNNNCNKNINQSSQIIAPSSTATTTSAVNTAPAAAETFTTKRAGTSETANNDEKSVSIFTLNELQKNKANKENFKIGNKNEFNSYINSYNNINNNIDISETKQSFCRSFCCCADVAFICFNLSTINSAASTHASTINNNSNNIQLISNKEDTTSLNNNSSIAENTMNATLGANTTINQSKKLQFFNRRFNGANSRFLTLALCFKSCLIRLKHFLYGFFFSVLICVSFIMMNFYLRRNLNSPANASMQLDEMHSMKSQRANLSASFTTTISTISDADQTLSSELDANPMLFSYDDNMPPIVELNCNYCYLFAWLSTSCLMFLYPMYFFFAFVVMRNHLKPSWQQQRSQSRKQQQQHSESQESKMATKSEQTAKNKINSTIESNMSNTKSVDDSQTNSASGTTNGKKPTASRSQLTKVFFDSFYIFDTDSVNSKKLPVVSTNLSKITKSKCLKHKNFLIKLFLISSIWLVSAYSYLRAIDLISCSDLIILFSVNYSFVYMIAWIFLQYRFLPMRLVGFILAITAIIFMYYSEGLIFNLRFLGNFLATLSAGGVAILQTIWNTKTKNKGSHQKTMFISLIGLCTFLLGWPLVILLYFTGLESFSFGSSSTLYKLLKMDVNAQLYLDLTLATVLGLIYAKLFLFGSSLTKEIYIQIGCFLCIPLSIVIDLRLNEYYMSSFKVGALICITLSYVCLILPEDLNLNAKRRFCQQSQEQVELSSLNRKYRYSTAATTNTNLLVNTNVANTKSNQLFKVLNSTYS